MSALPPKAAAAVAAGVSAKGQSGHRGCLRRQAIEIPYGLARRQAMKLPRRNFLHLAAGAAALPAVRALLGRKPIRRGRCTYCRLCRPAAQPTSSARLVGSRLSERLGQQFVIENRPGAGSNVGAEVVVRAPPDGYTLLFRSAADAINATLYRISVTISSATSRRWRALRRCLMSWWSIHRSRPRRCRSSSPTPRPIRQDQFGVGRHRHREPSGRRTVQDDGRSRFGPRPISRSARRSRT